MASSEHSLKVDDWLTETEARALENAWDVATELEDRAHSLSCRTDSIGEAIACGRIAERSRAVVDATSRLLISLRVYAESSAAAKVLDRADERDGVTS